MYIDHAENVPERTVHDEGAEKASIRWLISKPQGAPSFAMRLIEVQPGGKTPFHTHAFEHEVYVLEGQGEVCGASGSWPLREGSFVLVAPDEEHNFRNTGNRPLRFICCIPLPP